MKNSSALIALVLFSICTLAIADNSGWTSLTDLSHWRGYQKKEVPAAWKLEEGTITLDGAGGDLITREQYADFEFEFEWKIAPGGNSGLIYLCTEVDAASYMTGPEYQVLDDATHAEIDESQQAGSLYGLYTRTSVPTRPAGEWNQGRLIHREGHVEHWLNGVKIIEAEIGSDDWNKRVAESKFDAWKGFGKAKRGHLVFQDHGARVWYRKIRIRSLDQQPQAATNQSRRILMVTQSQGFEHSSIKRHAGELSHAERLFTELGIRSGLFRADCTKDVEKDFTPELLANYDTVVFYTTGSLPIPLETREWFLNVWLKEQGHSFLGVHCAADTYHDYEPYWDMIGGTFNGHPWAANSRVVIKVHDGTHPASKPWGATDSRIPWQDEIYQFKNWQPEKVRVLMSLDMQQTELKKPYHVPVLWVKPYGAGRVMHMSLGHREDVWTNPTYQESLLGGLRWLLGIEPGDATPNPELSAAEERLAKEAATLAAAH